LWTQQATCKRPDTDLTSNNTTNLIADSNESANTWISTDGCSSAAHGVARWRLPMPKNIEKKVTEIVLWGVTTGRHKEFDWLFRGGVAVLFPEQWKHPARFDPAADRDGDIVSAYYRLVNDPNPAIREASRLSMVYLGISNTELATY